MLVAMARSIGARLLLSKAAEDSEQSMPPPNSVRFGGDIAFLQLFLFSNFSNR